jgi:L-alanine-DL-glutamate epimerase-like enolase superfamily enzyme
MILDELVTNTSSITQLVADDEAEGVNIKMSKAGGLSRARRQRDIIIAAGLTIGVQDNVGSEISYPASMHVSQTIPER